MTLDRRQFVTALIASGAAAAVPAPSIDGNLSPSSAATSPANPPNTKVDFRYAPHHQQSTICFPDDPRKTIVGQAGDLRYGYVKSFSAGMENFGTVVEFSLAGFQDDKILRQWIESPAVPIVHTLIDRPAATFELIAFATRHAGEGRVDNVLLSIKAKSDSKHGRVVVVPKIHIRTCERLELESYTVPTATVRAQGSKSPLLVAAQLNSDLGSCMLWQEEGFTLYLPNGEAAGEVRGKLFRPAPAGRPISRSPDRTFARSRNALGRSSRVLEELEAIWNHELELPEPARGISYCVRAQHSTGTRGEE